MRFLRRQVGLQDSHQRRRFVEHHVGQVEHDVGVHAEEDQNIGQHVGGHEAEPIVHDYS